MTPYLLLVLFAFGAFMGVLGVYSIRGMIDDLRATRAAKPAKLP